jgi:redox-sensitive bicupin YhaK (pirin superfamily)
MIIKRPSAARGHANHGWLDTFHTFSFADYHDPAWMGFSALRVLNQDVVAPGRGFGTHGHADMEIVTWVLEGALQHRDSMGNGSIIEPSEAQLMSAGTGVTHSEFNASTTGPTELLQMWVLPERRGLVPRYEQKAFPDAELAGRLRLISSSPTTAATARSSSARTSPSTPAGSAPATRWPMRSRPDGAAGCTSHAGACASTATPSGPATARASPT